jgi:CxxC motif-containing protein (DUF1111 family)
MAWCALAACGDNSGPDESRAGGATTVDDRTFEAFGHPGENLTADQRLVFQEGRGPFNFHWEIPQLGPMFNNDACLGCHAGNGRGLSQIGNGTLVSQALIRVSLVDGTPDVPGGDVPVPGFGLQLQDHATVGLPEVTVSQSWVEHPEMYGDGEVVMLREPRVEPLRPDGTSLPDNVRMSFRQAPGVFGLGLLEAVPEADIAALADPDDLGCGIPTTRRRCSAGSATRRPSRRCASRSRPRLRTTSGCRARCSRSPTGCATSATASSIRWCSSCPRSACRRRRRKMRQPTVAAACSMSSAVPGVTWRP